MRHASPNWNTSGRSQPTPLALAAALCFGLGCAEPPLATAAAGARISSARTEPATSPPRQTASPTPALGAAPAPAPAPPPVPDYEQADLDPDNDFLVAPPQGIDDCAGRLERAGISFRPAVLRFATQQVPGGKGEVLSCGAEQVVSYRGGPARIRYNSPPLLTCRLALALGRLEQLAQEEALRHLHRRILRFTQGGTYNCRKMVRYDFVSEHSYANAIDIQEFWLEGGQRVSVRKHFGALGGAPQTPESMFLRALAERAFDEHLFSVVLTPYWDHLHRDHFHFDLARYHVDGTRPRGAQQ